MSNTLRTNIYDGDLQIIFSGAFNVYKGNLKIGGIHGYNIEIVFKEEDFSVEKGRMVIERDDILKKVLIIMEGFRSDMGAVNTKLLPILKLDDGEEMLISIYGKVISENKEFLNVVVNIYLKDK